MKNIATFANGCFWCTEEIFKNLRGVLKVTSGYAGGDKSNPTYEEVCNGVTGHAEAVQMEFDQAIISYEQLVEVFFLTHDPTTMNRQGGDIGTQYRSVIFYHDEEQRRIAEQMKYKIDADKIYDRPLVTAIEPFKNFYPAEDYHQDYYAKNSEAAYCQSVINPKLAKFRKKLAGLIKNPA